MNKNRKIAAFDFDNTLCPCPYEENISFMDNIESLECHNFELNECILNSYNCEKENGSTMVLLTNRHINLKEYLLNRLSEKGITFDIVLMLDIDRNKGNRLEPFIQDYDIIEFWDDKERHLNSVRELGKKYIDKTFILNLVE